MQLHVGIFEHFDQKSKSKEKKSIIKSPYACDRFSFEKGNHYYVAGYVGGLKFQNSIQPKLSNLLHL